MIELTSTFESHDWIIKYRLQEPPQQMRQPKQTVAFVHGTPWSSDVFQPIAKALLTNYQYRVLLYDLPGYGHSQTLQSISRSKAGTSQFLGDTSVATQAAVLAELLRHLRIDAPAIIAHDIAGAIALRAHLIYHVNFGSLLLLDTNALLPWGDAFYKLVRSKPDVFLELPPSIFEAMARAVIRSACFNPKVLDAGWEDALARPWIDGVKHRNTSRGQVSFVRQIAQAADTDVAEMLDGNMYCNVRCGVKIVWGEQDQWIPREKMNSLADQLGDRVKEFVVVPEAGHLVMLDQPERVAVEVVTWLAKHNE